MPNTLGLDDDLDGVELVQDIERAFDVRVSDEEAERTKTVGDLYELLLTKIPANDKDRKCASAMAFYRLRHGLEELGYGRKLSPSSELSFLQQGKTSAKLKALEQHTGLRLPKAPVTSFGCFSALACFFGSIAIATIYARSINSVATGFLLGVLLAYAILGRDPGTMPRDCKTLADLTRKVASLNYGRLVKSGASHRDSDIWENLLDLLSGYTLPRSEITRDTLFLTSQLKTSAAA